MMTDLTWKEPPERPTGLRFEKEAREMRENPGKWMLLQQFPPDQGGNARSMGNSIRIGRYTAFRPAGTFQQQTATETDDAGNPVERVREVRRR
jgi:hypothetical protein